MAVQALRKREVAGSTPAASTNFERANRASPARACPHSSNSLLSIMRQVTALVRRRGKFETCGEHHFCVGSPTGRRRFPQKEDSAGSNPSRRTNAHVDQRQESPPSKHGQCWFESNHGHQIAGVAETEYAPALNPGSCRLESCRPHHVAPCARWEGIGFTHRHDRVRSTEPSVPMMVRHLSP